MAKRKIYHVTKTDIGWKGKLEVGQRASIKGDTKVEVVKKTVVLARKQQNASVIIHKANAKFQEERTYPRNTDPFPPKG